MIGAIGGLIIGASYGYVARRGSFCMNSGFRSVIQDRDFNKFKAYALAIAIQMALLPLLFGFSDIDPIRPATFPVAAVLGGLLFGVSMRWAAGCAAGVWYKFGGGNLAAFAALSGMALGALLLESGPLSSMRVTMQSVGASAASSVPAVPPAVLLVLGFVLIIGLLRTANGATGEWSWKKTGALVGAIGIAAWVLSSAADRNFGMAVIPGTLELLAPKSWPGWDALFVLGIPVGGYVAARSAGPVIAQKPDVKTTLRRFIGGLGLGIGASLAAGCTVGHGLTGAPMLVPGSVLAIASIFAGSAISAVWTQRRARTPEGAQ